MKKHLLSQLRDLRDNSTEINPSKEWVASNREQLISQIYNTVSHNTNQGFNLKAQQIFRIFIPINQLHAVRGIFVFMLVFGVATGGLVASASPLPRDIVFNVKVAAATVTGNTQAKGKLHIEEAKHQTQELKRKLAGVDQSDTQEKQQKDVEKQLKKIKKQVDSAKKALEKAKNSEPNSATIIAKELTIETTAISESLKEVTERVLEDTQNKEEKEKNDTITHEVSEIRKGVVDAGVKAMEVLISQSDNNLILEDTEGVNTVVNEMIGELLEEAANVKLLAAETKIQLNFSKTEKTQSETTDVMEDYVAASSSAVSSSLVSDSSNQKITELETKANKTEEIAVKVKDSLAENKLNEAVSFLKDLLQSTIETKEAIVVTQELLLKKQIVEINENTTAYNSSTIGVSSTVESVTATESVIEKISNETTTTDSSL